MNIIFVIYIIAGPVFLMALIAHIYVKICLRPKSGSDFDDYYHEFEDQHPDFARYTKWHRITFIALTVSALMLFVATVI
jgi:hypothetical protein